MYSHQGEQILYTHRNGEVEHRADCRIALSAAQTLNDAIRLNDARKYTASARLYAIGRSLPGFKWRKGFDLG